MAVISISIDVTKIDKGRLITGKPQDRGGEEPVSPKYCDLTLIETPDSQYGDSHMVVQSVSKEEREAGERGPILGNAKTFGDLPQGIITPPTTASRHVVDPDDDVPF